MDILRSSNKNKWVRETLWMLCLLIVEMVWIDKIEGQRDRRNSVSVIYWLILQLYVYVPNTRQFLKQILWQVNVKYAYTAVFILL